jgi:uncharacterized membrane protein
MLYLVLGLVIFLGIHSVRIVADDWRNLTRDRIGALPWKGLYSLVSIAGFALIVWGFGQTRADPVVLWTPPLAMRHVAGLLTLVSFILLVAAYIPRNAFKVRLRHPMILGVKVWALAHLLANGRLSHVVLFGAFLIWAILDFRSCRQRDQGAAPVAVRSATLATVLTLVIGVAAWVGFAFWGHQHLIGVAPMAVR